MSFRTPAQKMLRVLVLYAVYCVIHVVFDSTLVGAQPVDAMPLEKAQVFRSAPDVASWPITTAITKLDLGADDCNVEFSKKSGPDKWPEVEIPGWNGGKLQYTLWMVREVNGEFVTAGGIEFWDGRVGGCGAVKDYVKNWYYDGSWGPLGFPSGGEPAPGERVGFFVTAGDARVKDMRYQKPDGSLLAERSAVVAVPFPSAAGASFSFAQTPQGWDGQNHLDWIQAAKDELIQHGVSLADSACGPFQIINLAAWRHKETGLGLLSKPGGNHCEYPAGSGNFYSVDWLVYPNGQGGDMIIGAGEANTPTWGVGAPDAEAASRWRPPVDPGFSGGGGGGGGTTVDLTPLLKRLDALEQRATAAEAKAADLVQQLGALEVIVNSAVANFEGRIGTLEADTGALKAKPVPASCSAAINLGGVRIPISCRLNP